MLGNGALHERRASGTLSHELGGMHPARNAPDFYTFDKIVFLILLILDSSRL
jgi:hypothetical protein